MKAKSKKKHNQSHREKEKQEEDKIGMTKTHERHIHKFSARAT
jgi:hypothetical protein